MNAITYLLSMAGLGATVLLVAIMIAPPDAHALTDTTCPDDDDEGRAPAWMCNHEDTTP